MLRYMTRYSLRSMLATIALAAMALATVQGGTFSYVAFYLVTVTAPFLILFAVAATHDGRRAGRATASALPARNRRHAPVVHSRWMRPAIARRRA